MEGKGEGCSGGGGGCWEGMLGWEGIWWMNGQVHHSIMMRVN